MLGSPSPTGDPIVAFRCLVLPRSDGFDSLRCYELAVFGYHLGIRCPCMLCNIIHQIPFVGSNFSQALCSRARGSSNPNEGLDPMLASNSNHSGIIKSGPSPLSTLKPLVPTHMGCTSSKPFKDSTTKPKGEDHQTNGEKPGFKRKSKKEEEHKPNGVPAPPWVTKQPGVFVPDPKNSSGGYVVSRAVFDGATPGGMPAESRPTGPGNGQ